MPHLLKGLLEYLKLVLPGERNEHQRLFQNASWAPLVTATLVLRTLRNRQTGITAPEMHFTLLIIAEMKVSAHVISYSCLKLFFNLVQRSTKITQF